MGRYQARDLLLVPSLLSLTRVPLAVGFVFIHDSIGFALGVLLLAGVTDVLDGWYARRHQLVTPTGAVVDGISDKLFAGTVVVVLVADGTLSVPQALLLATREIGELPLVAWWAAHRGRRRRRAEDPKANGVGKLASIVQFAAVAAALIRSPLLNPLLYFTAAVGAMAAWIYWQRELRTLDRAAVNRN